MKLFNLFRNVILLTFPFLLMVVINEAVRPTIKEKPFQQNKIIAINSALKLEQKCSWACHNIESYCKDNHTKILQGYFHITDPVYFGTIRLLQSTGKYKVANIVVLAILIPLIMYFLLIKSLSLQSKIRKTKMTKENYVLLFFTDDWIAKIYFYCTDFIINLANILKLSYYEINFFIFCLFYPLIVMLLSLVFILQRVRLSRIKSYALRQTN